MDRLEEIPWTKHEHEARPEAQLTPEQRELLRSLKRSMRQAARGEGRPVQELLRELRMKRAAEDNADYRNA